MKECALDKKRLNKVCNDGDNGGVESCSSSNSSSSSSSSGSRSDTSLYLIDRWFYHITSYITSRLRLPQQQLSGQQLSGQQLSGQQLSGQQQQQQQQQDIHSTHHYNNNTINDHVDTFHGRHDNGPDDDHYSISRCGKVVNVKVNDIIQEDILLPLKIISSGNRYNQHNIDHDNRHDFDYDDCHKEHGCDITTTTSSDINLGYNKVDYRKHNDNQINNTAAIKCILLDGDDDLRIHLSMYHRISSNRHHDDDSDDGNNGYHKIYNRYISIAGDPKKINKRNDVNDSSCRNDINDVNDSSCRSSGGSYGDDSNGFIIDKDERELLAYYSRIVASKGDR
jgi:hypothetical protein